MAHPAAPEINTTPLIDVLLVLLVLLVLTFPRSTHRTALDLPAGSGGPRSNPESRIDIDVDGRVFWNGTPVQDERRLEE